MNAYILTIHLLLFNIEIPMKTLEECWNKATLVIQDTAVKTVRCSKTSNL